MADSPVPSGLPHPGPEEFLLGSVRPAGKTRGGPDHFDHGGDFFRGERVATHRLRASNEQGRYATNPGHYPEAQKTLLETVPGALLRKASDIGPLTERLVKDSRAASGP